MGYKLGKATQPYMTNGVIKSRLSFHKEGGDSDISVPGTPVIRKPLAPGVMGEANMDGSIYINENIVLSMFASPIIPGAKGFLITGVPGTDASLPAS